MVQPSVDSKLSEHDPGNSKMDLPNCDKQLTAPVKKTALRDLQNDNKLTVPASMGSSSFLKDKGRCTDSNRISGTKRPSSESPVNLHLQQSPGNNAANGHLVYVRRKSEAELGKSTACENPSVSVYCSLSSSRHLCEEETAQQKPQIKEPKVSCFPAFSPFPMASSISSSGKPSVPISIGKSAMRLSPVESNFVTASAIPTIGNTTGSKNVHWEERYHRLQMFLRKLDQTDQEEYIQMLHSLSSIELSRHAVELEKRSIQLSLEEAKELQRVAVLNVLGKPLKSFKAPADHHGCSEK
ncbi:Protein LIN52 [Senna tora]|uniref:Protein LIN52 n=1 Tax=Senna tora TaxID=362788 RepID=A0A834XED3_9FABA|nr:Protein LIN52 [Senna tora]